MTTPVSALTFPTEFTVKVMGKNTPEFEQAVTNIFKAHYPHLAETAYSKRLSKDGHYIAFSITVEATSKAELDALYQDLTQEPQVLMAL